MKTLLNKSVFAVLVILLSASLLVAGGNKSEKYSKKEHIQDRCSMYHI